MSRAAFDFRIDPRTSVMLWRPRGDAEWQRLTMEATPPEAFIEALSVARHMPGFYDMAALPQGVTLDAFMGDDANGPTIAAALVYLDPERPAQDTRRRR